MESLRKLSLTNNELLELICDVAYEQATRDVSGVNWYQDLVRRIIRKTGSDARCYVAKKGKLNGKFTK